MKAGSFCDSTDTYYVATHLCFGRPTVLYSPSVVLGAVIPYLR